MSSRFYKTLISALIISILPLACTAYDDDDDDETGGGTKKYEKVWR